MRTEKKDKSIIKKNVGRRGKRERYTKGKGEQVGEEEEQAFSKEI